MRESAFGRCEAPLDALLHAESHRREAWQRTRPITSRPAIAKWL